MPDCLRKGDRRNYIRSLSEAQSFLFTSGYVDTIDYTYKSTNREELNSLYAQRETADDILVVRNGYLTDTSISNIALYDGNTWFTPSCPLLKGIKRAELLDKHLIQEKEILHTQLGSYFRIMLFNAMIDWGQIVIPIDEKHLIL